MSFPAHLFFDDPSRNYADKGEEGRVVTKTRSGSSSRRRRRKAWQLPKAHDFEHDWEEVPESTIHDRHVVKVNVPDLIISKTYDLAPSQKLYPAVDEALLKSVMNASSPGVETSSPESIPHLTIEFKETSRQEIFWNTSEKVIVAHACNTQGHWGRGFALEVKKLYPNTYTTYREFCLSFSKSSTNVGKAMLIYPDSSAPRRGLFRPPYIGCLFTNQGIGGSYLSSKHMQDTILKATKTSLEALLQGIQISMNSKEIEPISEIRMPMINSGLFRVPWPETEKLLSHLELPLGFDKSIKIIVYKLNRPHKKHI